MNLVLCTNNKYQDPFLHSQLLCIYNNFEKINKTYLFCRYSNQKNDGIINIDFGKLSFVVYFFKMLQLLSKLDTKDTILHIRGYVSSFIFFFVRLVLFWKNFSYIYDPRGSYIDEFTESTRYFNRNNFLLKILRMLEKSIIKNSIKTIVTTIKFKEFYKKQFLNESKYELLYNTSAIKNVEYKKIDLLSKEIIEVCYMGSIDYWHNLDEIIRVLNYIQRITPKKIKINFFTNYYNKNYISEKLSKVGLVNFEISFITYEQAGERLKQIDICVSVVKPTLSKRIASPIKVSDYIMLNKIIIMNEGIGDFDNHFKKNNSALLYEYGKDLNFTFDEILNLNADNSYLKDMLSIERNIEKIKSILNKVL